MHVQSNWGTGTDHFLWLTVFTRLSEGSGSHHALRSVGQRERAAQRRGPVQLVAHVIRWDAVGSCDLGTRDWRHCGERRGDLSQSCDQVSPVKWEGVWLHLPTLVGGVFPRKGCVTCVGEGSWGGLSESVMLVMVWECRRSLPSPSDWPLP